MLAVVGDARMRAGAGHAAWSESFKMFAQVAGVFANAPARRHGRAYLLGLLSHTERKNSWWLAEFAGDTSPDGMQRLLNFSPWDEDACRDTLARYVARNLGDAGAVLAAGETGFLKKGTQSAGVARQYTATAGRVENSQAGVFLAYAAPDGSRALIDRELYLPEKWTGDRERCRAAGIGDDVAFAAKPQLAKSMIGRAVKAGVPFSWVTGDEAYGGNPGLREWLGKEKIPYVLGIACNAMIATAVGAKRADGLAALVPAAGWQRLSCADGSKGPGLYDWALIGTDSPQRWLLVRRPLHPNEKGELELAFFRCYSPRTASPGPRMRPAWTTTRSASTAPGTATSPCLCSPTRSWPSPPAPPGPPRARRNLSLPAGTLPASRAKRGPDACGQIFAPPRTYAPPAFITDDSGRDLIPLTAGEARRLFNLHTRVTHPDEYHVRWSDWRRYRQAAARRSHYARRAEVPGHV